MTFAEQLREAMGDMTQERLAHASSVPQQTISRLLLGQSEPSYATLMRLHKALPRLREIMARGEAA